MPQDFIPKPHAVPADYVTIELADVIDAPALQEMMNDYYALTGIGVGIIDLKGTVLVGTGWQDICTRFHRATPESRAYCHESDIYLSSGIPPGTFREYRCKNNMWDIATPIMLGDRHIGNIFLGQYFYDDEEPDYELFRSQARRFGYDETEYLAALDRIPRLNRETVQTAMRFYAKLARMISRANYTNVVLADTLAKQKQAEDALQWMRISVETSSDALFWITPDARIVEVNAAACSSLGYSREELLQMTVPDFDPHFNAGNWPKQFAKLRKYGSLTFESEHHTRDGRIFPVEIVANHVKIGSEERHCAFVRDITVRKRMEQSLKESKERYRRIVETAREGIVASNESAVITYVNHRMADLLGYQEEEMPGRSLLDFFEQDTREKVLAQIEQRKAGISSRYENVMLRKNGEKIWVTISGSPIFDENGAFAGSFAMVSNITARKKAEQAIVLLNTNLAARAAELESVNRDLETFNYTVSHDLRAPLTTISMCNQIIQVRCGNSPDEEFRKVIRILDEQILRMNQIISTLLNFSRLTNCPVRRENVNLSRLVQIAAAQLQLIEPQRQVTFHIAKGVEASGDEELLMTVMENLVGNAWKYSSHNESAVIEFGVAEIEGETTYFVRDNGSGFDMEYADRLLLPFQRLPGAEECQGFGIGLATVDRIINRHGGRVWAEGEPGKGATFYFTLNERTGPAS